MKVGAFRANNKKLNERALSFPEIFSRTNQYKHFKDILRLCALLNHHLLKTFTIGKNETKINEYKNDEWKKYLGLNNS